MHFKKAILILSLSISMVLASSPDVSSAGSLENQIDSHLDKMEDNLSVNPEDKKLEKRFEKAKILSEKANNCLKMEQAVENASDVSVPTAGISSLMSDIAGSSGWHESYYGYAIDCLSLEENSDYFHGYYGLSDERKKIVNTAISCEGKIHYVWGGKPLSPEFLPSWEKGIGGLDCSGFVTWVYWNALGTKNADPGLMSTYSISRNKEEISYAELLPGDLGMITDEGTYYTDIVGNKFVSSGLAAQSSQKLKDRHKEIIEEKKEQQASQKSAESSKKKVSKDDTKKDTVGQKTKASARKHTKNASSEDKKTDRIAESLTSSQLSASNSTTHASHVGIYVGKDENGDDLWCHCTGGSIRTVVVNHYDRFQHYYRILPVSSDKEAKKDVKEK